MTFQNAWQFLRQIICWLEYIYKIIHLISYAITPIACDCFLNVCSIIFRDFSCFILKNRIGFFYSSWKEYSYLLTQRVSDWSHYMLTLAVLCQLYWYHWHQIVKVDAVKNKSSVQGTCTYITLAIKTVALFQASLWWNT